MDEGKFEKSRKAIKVKNPCKICATSVNQKTGLQCNGACKKWIHYACLKYTPGKIQDIKDGFIKIVCPCPDCQGSGPREEIISKPPYRCAKSCCPAVESPTCDSLECPANKNEVPSCPPAFDGLAPPQILPPPNAYPPQVVPLGMPMNNLQLPEQPNQLCPDQTYQANQPYMQNQPLRPQCANPQCPRKPMPPQTFGNQRSQPVPPIIQQTPCPINQQQPNQISPQQPHNTINQQQPNLICPQQPPCPNNQQQPNQISPQQPHNLINQQQPNLICPQQPPCPNNQQQPNQISPQQPYNPINQQQPNLICPQQPPCPNNQQQPNQSSPQQAYNPINQQQPNLICPQQPPCPNNQQKPNQISPQQPYNPINQQQPNLIRSLQPPCPIYQGQPNLTSPEQPATQVINPPQKAAPQICPEEPMKKKNQAKGPSYATPAKQSKSCSCLSNESNKDSVKERGQSETHLKESCLYANLEEMCKTVGLLTTQIKQLMCKLVKRSKKVKEDSREVSNEELY